MKIFPVIRFSVPAGNVMETLEKLIKSPEAAFPCIFINWAESSAVWWILEFSRIWKNLLWFIAFEAGFGNSAKSISAISQFVNLSKINQLQRICRQCIIIKLLIILIVWYDHPFLHFWMYWAKHLLYLYCFTLFEIQLFCLICGLLDKRSFSRLKYIVLLHCMK